MTPEERLIWGYLLENQRWGQPIRAEDLAAMSGFQERTVRKLIKSLVEEFQKPIGSTTKTPGGYYIITNEEEIKAVRASLYRRAISILKRARKYEAKRSDWVARMIGQLELLEKD